mgnify:CR=1 FL=1
MAMSRIIPAALAALAACAGPAAAQPPENFAGRTITLVNNFPPGGASDLWARLNARHIGRFLPGAPSVIVQNRGGAAGNIGAELAAKSPPCIWSPSPMECCTALRKAQANVSSWKRCPADTRNAVASHWLRRQSRGIRRAVSGRTRSSAMAGCTFAIRRLSAATISSRSKLKDPL